MAGPDAPQWLAGSAAGIGSARCLSVQLAATLADAATASPTTCVVPPSSPFQSFWMGGYEGADHINGTGQALDMAMLSGHLDQLEDDHRRAAALGIRTVRESIGWRLAEPTPGCFDLSRALRIASSARRHGLQVIWSLMHYGTPADVSLVCDATGATLSDRFTAFAAAVAQALAPFSDAAPIYNPINEISFIAWAVSQSNLLHPYRGDPTEGDPLDPKRHGHALGYAVKRRLVHAALRGLEAMRRIDPRARFLHVEPLVHVVAPSCRPDLAATAAEVSSYQWQTWDMLCGRTEPQLGGAVHALDLIGVNHYHNSQWEVPSEQRLAWHLRDPRRAPLATLLGAAWQRYQRPLIVAETSHFGDGRAAWLDEIADEVTAARAAGVPVDGLCLYPLIDRPDWTDTTHWHRSGMWDVANDATGMCPASAPVPAPSASASPSAAPPAALRRVLYADYAQALARWQLQLPGPAWVASSVASSVAPNRPWDASLKPSGTTFPSNPSLLPSAPKPWLVVLSHLHWDSHWQRPQQLLTRLSRQYRVLFVEAPHLLTGDSITDAITDAITDTHAVPVRLDRISRGPDLTLLVAHLGDAAHGFDDAACARLAPALTTFLNAHAITHPLVWIDTPMAWALLAELQPRAVVYDCMMDPSACRAAPDTLLAHEAALLHRADLVLTSGPSQHAAKRLLRPTRQLVANAVDGAHFDPAGLDAHSHEGRETRLLLARFSACSGPRIGYAGAIDDRLDLNLITRLCDAHPDWQFVMVGPICGIDVTCLPQRPNLHWLGPQPYARLPHLYASWDVCLLPFHVNADTRCANPLQILECLAAGKPVVSTPVPDAVAQFGTTVQFASDAAGLSAACAQALTQTPAAREQRARRMVDVVRANSWDERADTMLALLHATLARLDATALSR